MSWNDPTQGIIGPTESSDSATFGLLGEFAPCPGFVPTHWDGRGVRGNNWVYLTLTFLQTI